MAHKTGSGIGNLVWVRDKDGKEYACSVDALSGNIQTKEELTAEERKNCMDVSTIIGTERW
ncbi:MAG: hypothetical protein KKD73_06795 [Proteobacteria bacterium]|nr:hypothetical protein [Pseudomonadota bacterium]MBU1638998.1 hypothetical protein [Pseudomonadota bacterium]